MKEAWKPWLFLLGAWTVFALPIFQGKVLFPSGWMRSRIPWSLDSRDPPQRHVLMGDVVQEMVPWQIDVRDQWLHGHVPLWREESLAGEPMAGNDQSAPFFPGNLLAVLFPRSWQLTIPVLFKLLLAGAGMIVLLRSWDVSPAGQALGAVVYAWSWELSFWLAWPFTTVAATLPWIVWGVERVLVAPGVASAAVLALTTGLSFLGGSAETTAQMLSAAGVLLIARSIACGHDRRAIGVRLGWALAGVVAGTLVAGVQLGPFVELLHRSWIWTARAGTGVGHLPLSRILLWFAPDALGNAGWRDPSWHLPDPWQSGFVGLSVLGLAATAAFVPSRRRVVAPLLCLAGVFFCITYGIGLHVVYGHLPLLSRAPNHRLVAIVSFAVVAAAAVGLDGLTQIPAARSRMIVFTVAAVVCSIASAALLPESHPPPIRLAPPILGGIAAVVVVATLLPERREACAWALAAIGALEVLLVMGQYTPWSDPASVFPREGAFAALIGSQEGTFAAYDGMFPPDVSAAYGLRDMRTYEPMVTERWRRFYDHLDPDTRDAGFTLVLAHPQLEWLRIAGVDRYLMPALPDPGTWHSIASPGPDGFLEGHSMTQVLHCDDGEVHLIQLAATNAAFVHVADGSGEIPVQAAGAPDRSIHVRLQRPITCPADATVTLQAAAGVSLRAAASRGGSEAIVDGKAGSAGVWGALWTLPPGREVRWLGPLAVIEDREAPPFAWISTSATIVHGESDAESTLASLAGTSARPLVIEDDGTAMPPSAPLDSSESLTFRRTAAGAVDLETHTRMPRIVVVQESWDPGWRVTIDGAPARPQVANLVFQAIRVGPGEHRVRMRYSPAGFRFGLLASIASLLACGWALRRQVGLTQPGRTVPSS